MSILSENMDLKDPIKMLFEISVLKHSSDPWQNDYCDRVKLAIERFAELHPHQFRKIIETATQKGFQRKALNDFMKLFLRQQGFKECGLQPTVNLHFGAPERPIRRMHMTYIYKLGFRTTAIQICIMDHYFATKYKNIDPNTYHAFLKSNPRFHNQYRMLDYFIEHNITTPCPFYPKIK